MLESTERNSAANLHSQPQPGDGMAGKCELSASEASWEMTQKEPVGVKTAAAPQENLLNT